MLVFFKLSKGKEEKYVSLIFKGLILTSVLMLAGCGGIDDDDDGISSADNGSSVSNGSAVSDGSSEENSNQNQTTAPPTVVQPVSGPQPALGSIENLFGTVTFRSRVSGSSNEVESSVVFTPEDEGDLVRDTRNVSAVNSDLDGFICAELESVDAFLCGKVALLGAREEFFLFSLSSQFAGSGNYELCDELGSGAECGMAILDSLDGTVDVSISRNTVMASAVRLLNGEPISSSELVDYIDADKLEFSGKDSNAASDVQSAQIARALEQMVEKLRK